MCALCKEMIKGKMTYKEVSMAYIELLEDEFDPHLEDIKRLAIKYGYLKVEDE